MTTDSVPAPARTAPGLLVTTRVLAGLHALAGLGAVAFAGYSFLSYANAPADETFAGLWLIFGAGYVVLGLGLLALGLGGALARSPGGVYACGAGAGIFALVASGPSSWLLPFAGLGVLLAVVPLLLVVCSVIGLATAKSNRS